MFEAHDALLCIGQKTYVNDEKEKNIVINITLKAQMK